MHLLLPNLARVSAAPWLVLLAVPGQAINPLVEVSHVEQNSPAHPAEGYAQTLLEQTVADGLGCVADVGSGFLDGQESLGWHAHLTKNATNPWGLMAGLPAGRGLACLGGLPKLSRSEPLGADAPLHFLDGTQPGANLAARRGYDIRRLIAYIDQGRQFLEVGGADFLAKPNA